jgi:3-methyladenine DNA glycosylase AlkD
MQAYMKSEMPYLGVQTPALRKAVRPLIAGHPLEEFEAWHDTAAELWRSARHREERYTALELCGHRVHRAHQTMKALPLYEELVVTGAWWDYVDAIASNGLGTLLAKHPGPMRRKMLSWARSRDLWKRRSAILCQLRFKEATDLELLWACIEPSLASEEFFLRKGIGWALRTYAWTDPEEIVRYVKRHRNELSPLSKREALKNVIKAGLLDAVP